MLNTCNSVFNAHKSELVSEIGLVFLGLERQGLGLKIIKAGFRARGRESFFKRLPPSFLYSSGLVQEMNDFPKMGLKSETDAEAE